MAHTDAHQPTSGKYARIKPDQDYLRIIKRQRKMRDRAAIRRGDWDNLTEPFQKFPTYNLPSW